MNDVVKQILIGAAGDGSGGMVQRMGALDCLMQRQATAGEQAVDHLARMRGALKQIQQLAEEQARGQDRTNVLLHHIR